MPTIAVVVCTLNEAEHLPFALRSVRPWADELVVVDMASHDATAEVARTYGARLLAHERLGFAEPLTLASRLVATDWVLVLDADDLVPRALSLRLQEIARLDLADAVLVSTVEHTGAAAANASELRFLKRDALHSDGRNPARLRSQARVLDLAGVPGTNLVCFRDLATSHVLDRLNARTDPEALRAVDRGALPRLLPTLWRAASAFALHYLGRGGFARGPRGLNAAAVQALRHVAIYAKVRELLEWGARSNVQDRYHAHAERLLAAYREPRPPTP